MFLSSQIKDVNFLGNYKIIKPSNLYGCTLDKNVFIGPFVEIQCNSFIGENTRVQSHSFICSNVKIDKNCFIGHSVCFINDKFSNGKLETNKNNFLNTHIGEQVLIGSNSTILPVKICSGTVIGAGSVVTKDINKKGIYVGNPAKFLRSID